MQTQGSRRRTDKRISKKAAIIVANSSLLERLDAMAALPADACGACGSDKAHRRCNKCGDCNPGVGEPTRFMSHIEYGCGSCGARSSRYSQPVYMWTPRLPFAATFAQDLAGRIRRGIAPSEKQIALVDKLARDSERKPYVWERPALWWLSTRSRAWKAVYALVEREAWSILPGLDLADPVHGKAVSHAVRACAQRIIEDRTGYAVLTHVDDYDDAMRAAAGDDTLYAALSALLEMHAWLLRERRVVDPTPADRVELRRAVALGDAESAVVLADACQEAA